MGTVRLRVLSTVRSQGRVMVAVQIQAGAPVKGMSLISTTALGSWHCVEVLPFFSAGHADKRLLRLQPDGAAETLEEDTLLVDR